MNFLYFTLGEAISMLVRDFPRRIAAIDAIDAVMRTRPRVDIRDRVSSATVLAAFPIVPSRVHTRRLLTATTARNDAQRVTT
jgi:hypothetical protein